MIADDIHRIRLRIPTIDDIAHKRVHLTTPAGQTMGAPPTPINLAAQDTLDQLHALARILTAKAGLRHGAHAPNHALWQGLDRPRTTRTLEQRDDHDDITRILHNAETHTRHWTQPRPALRLIGICPNHDCRKPQWADEHTAPDERLDCPHCHTTYTPASLLQDLAPAIEWITGTAATLTRILNTTGLHVSTGLIRQYAHTGRIHLIGQDHHGYPVYRLGDILDVWRKHADKTAGKTEPRRTTGTATSPTLSDKKRRAPFDSDVITCDHGIVARNSMENI